MKLTPTHQEPKIGSFVRATDSTGQQYEGFLHHRNQCGQFYVVPQGARQPFYAFSSALVVLPGKYAGSLGSEDALGPDTGLRQSVYIAHRQKKTW